MNKEFEHGQYVFMYQHWFDGYSCDYIRVFTMASKFKSYADSSTIIYCLAPVSPTYAVRANNLPVYVAHGDERLNHFLPLFAKI